MVKNNTLLQLSIRQEHTFSLFFGKKLLFCNKTTMAQKDVKKTCTLGPNYDTDRSVSTRQQLMVNNKFMSDVTFIVGPSKQRIYAHKYILVMASEYFYTMFNSNFTEATQKEVVLPDNDPEVFLTVLRLIYGAQVEITDDNIRAIYDCLQMFMLTEFTQPFSDFLVSKVDRDSVMKIFRENGHYNLLPVDEECMHYIQNNHLYYFARQEFNNLDSNRLELIFRAKQINCTEDQLERVLRAWAEANPDNDIKQLSELLEDRKRSFYSHKLPIWNINTRHEAPTRSYVGLTLKDDIPLAWYGFGMNIKTKTEFIKVAIRICEGYQTQLIKSEFNFINTCVGDVQVLDLMFEEIVLKPGQSYKLYITSPGAGFWYADERIITLNDMIQIIFENTIRAKEYHVISHMWTKCPACKVKGHQRTEQCCNGLYSHNKV